MMVGVLILASGYKKLEWKDIPIAIIPMVLLSVIASPLNYYFGADYMQIYSGDGVPLMNDFAAYLDSKKLRPLFTYIMLAAYMILSGAVVSIAKLIAFIKKKVGEKALPAETPTEAPEKSSEESDNA